MTKMLIPEMELINAINAALRKDWTHKDWHCQVTALKKVSLPNRNWEVAMDSTGGMDLRYAADCDALKERVLKVLVQQYDVRWPP